MWSWKCLLNNNPYSQWSTTKFPSCKWFILGMQCSPLWHQKFSPKYSPKTPHNSSKTANYVCLNELRVPPLLYLCNCCTGYIFQVITSFLSKFYFILSSVTNVIYKGTLIIHIYTSQAQVSLTAYDTWSYNLKSIVKSLLSALIFQESMVSTCRIQRQIYSRRTRPYHGCWWPGDGEREREIKFIGLFENRGHRGSYKPFNHNLYIGIIIFPHIDNPQYTGYDLPKKIPNKIISEKSEGPINLTNHWRKRLWSLATEVARASAAMKLTI